MAQVGIHPATRIVTFLKPNGEAYFEAEVAENTKGGDEMYAQSYYADHPAWKRDNSNLKNSFAKADAEQKFIDKFGEDF